MDKKIDVFRKIAVIGDVGVGKSSLTERYATGHFNDAYDPTIENTVRKTITANDVRFNLEIVDTAGISEYSTRLSRNSTIGVHGYVLVFSIASRSSLEKMRSVNNLLFSTLGDPPQVPRILVATMCDLKEQRVVSKAQGTAIAADLGIQYFECSAKTGENINAVFSAILKEIEDDEPKTVEDPAPAQAAFCSIA